MDDLRQKADDLNHYRADRGRMRRQKIALFSIMPSDDLRPLDLSVPIEAPTNRLGLTTQSVVAAPVFTLSRNPAIYGYNLESQRI